MDQPRSPWILGLGAIALSAGCAQVPLAKVEAPATGPKVAPVYRVQQPAGTAAGQYAVGRIDLAEGRVDAAIARFRNALNLDRGFVEAHNGLGVAYGQQGRFAEAADAFRAALALTPDAPHVLNNLGFAQLKAGQLDEAWVSLKRSLALDARNERTRENIELLASVRAATLAEAAAGATPAASASVAAAPVPAHPAAVPANVASAAASGAPAPVSKSAPVSAPISESRPVAAPIVASSTVAEPARVSVPVAAPATLAVRVPGGGPAAEPPPAEVSVRAPMVTAPVAAAVVKPVAAPVVVPARPAYEIIVSRSNESALVQLAPNVYELRSGPSASTLSAAAAPAAPAAPATAAVAPPPQPLPIPFVATSSDAPRTVQASKRPVATVSLAALDGVEVSNGVGIRHLAGRTARTLSGLGVTVARVSDYRLFGRQRTEIHYRNGHISEAMAVRTTLPVGARLIQSARLHPEVNVRLVIGKDLVERQVAWLGSDGMTADAEGSPVSAPSRVAQGDSLDLVPHAAKIARANVDNGWRYL